MLYLIKSSYYNPETEETGLALKIGYADQVIKRLPAYGTHCAGYKLLCTRDGGLKEEEILHTYFNKYRIDLNREWFYYSDEIVEKFKNFTEGDLLDSQSYVKLRDENVKDLKTKLKNFLYNRLMLTFDLKDQYISDLLSDFLDSKEDFLDYSPFFHKKTEKDWRDFYKDVLKTILSSVLERNNLRDTILETIPKECPWTWKAQLTFNKINVIPEDSFIASLKEKGITWVEKVDIELNKFLESFAKDTSLFEDRMRLYCEYSDKWGNERLKHIGSINRDYHLYYDIVGSKKMRALGFQKYLIKNEVSIYRSSDELFLRFKETFQLGKRYTKKDIKSIIQNIYNSLGFKKKSMVTDLNQYFELRRCRITVNGKKEEGFEILKIK